MNERIKELENEIKEDKQLWGEPYAHEDIPPENYVRIGQLSGIKEGIAAQIDDELEFWKSQKMRNVKRIEHLTNKRKELLE